MRRKTMETMGKVLKEWRTGAGLSQGELAEKLGYRSPQIVSNWERSRCGIPVKKAALFCKATGAKQKDLQTIIFSRMQSILTAKFFSEPVAKLSTKRKIR